MRPERSGFALPALCVILLLWLVSEAFAAPPPCAMCARPCNIHTLATVTLTNGKSMDYCCPHCAAMGVGMLDLSQTSVQSVTLTDYSTRQRVASERASCLLESDVVPCCAPSVLAFSSIEAAKQFQRRHGGTVCSWQTVAEKLTRARCAVCPMSVYPPTAFIVTAWGKRSYGCCPVCALAAALKAGGTAAITHWITNPRRRLEVRLENGRIVSQAPASWVIWQITPPEGGQLKCHSWVVVADAKSLDSWRKAHPEAKGEVVTLESLLPRAQMKAKPAKGG